MRAWTSLWRPTSLGVLTFKNTAGNLPYGEYLIVTESAAQQEAVAWLGTLFLCVVSNLIVWPLAWLIRSLPGFRDVL